MIQPIKNMTELLPSPFSGFCFYTREEHHYVRKLIIALPNYSKTKIYLKFFETFNFILTIDPENSWKSVG